MRWKCYIKGFGFSYHLHKFQERRQLSKCSETPSTFGLCQGFTIGYNSICKLYFRNADMVLLSEKCSRNWPQIPLFLLWDVLGFLRKSAGCYNLLWQASLSGAGFIVRHYILSPTCCASRHRQSCVQTSDSSLPQAVKRVPFYVKFSTVLQETSSNLIKIICGKMLMRKVRDQFVTSLKEKNNKF